GGHMPRGRLSTLARAMRERAQFDASAGPGGGIPSPGGGGRGVVSRRGLLRLGGAVGVSAAVAACTTRSSPAASGTKAGAPAAPGVRVAVIGAGLAGTTAAYRLARSGVQVRLYEARDRIGGRCWTARGFADGQTAEHGGEFIDTRHVHIRQLARQLGLQLDDLWAARYGSFYPLWADGRVRHSDLKAAMTRISDAAAVEAKRVGALRANGSVTTAPLSYGTASP